MEYSWLYCPVCGQSHINFDGMDLNKRCSCGLPVTACFTERWFEPGEIEAIKERYKFYFGEKI